MGVAREAAATAAAAREVVGPQGAEMTAGEGMAREAWEREGEEEMARAGVVGADAVVEDRAVVVARVVGERGAEV